MFRRCALFLFIIPLLSPYASLCQTQTVSAAIPWSTLRTTCLQLKQSLINGAARPAHMRVIQMELLLSGSAEAPKVARQIASMESRPIPADNMSLGRFLPAVDDLLQAIDQGDSTAAYTSIQQLNIGLGNARVALASRTSASLVGTNKDSAILDLQMRLEHSLNVDDVATSVVLATDMQGMINDLVANHQFVTEYAFNYYMVNDAMGRAAFAAGDYQAASNYLQLAAETPPGVGGTVRLDSFGPNLWLAEQLLRVGKTDVVLKFLQTTKERFWLQGNEKADPWIAALQSGKASDLLPNSAASYGYLGK